jgi:exopolysaccharide biosynthesis polyprenyl glycosylphosphotransferase
MHRHGHRVLILGTSPLAYALAAEISSRPACPYVVVGLVEESPGKAPTLNSVMCLGDMDSIEEIIEEVQPACIAMALHDSQRVPDDVLLQARVRGVDIEEASHLYERVTGKLAIDMLTPRALFLCDGFRHSEFLAHSDLSQALTQCMNLFLAVIGLALLAPLCGLIALAIRLESQGPIFFVHQRIGRGGRPFGLIKFRTMRETDKPKSEWVCDNVDRITPLGKILRRFRLDELPQLVNVIRGEMNLVGPRPHPVTNYRTFLEAIPYYGLRAVVRPGLTGWAQIRYGYANSIAEELEKMRYDLYYIKHRSIWLDLRILAATFRLLVITRTHDSTERQKTRAAMVDAWPGAASGVSLR